MDRVRFGRALGTGARAAAKTLMSAAEAAAAPDPNPAVKRTAEPERREVAPAAAQARPQPVPPKIVMPDTRQVAGHAKNLKRTVWSPLARYSSVLWLEVTGFFFSIFAIILGNQVWRQRGAVHLPVSDPAAQHLYIYVALFALFAYFTVSSFVRAKRRGRR